MLGNTHEHMEIGMESEKMMLRLLEILNKELEGSPLRYVMVLVNERDGKDCTSSSDLSPLEASFVMDSASAAMKEQSGGGKGFQDFYTLPKGGDKH